MVVPNHVAEEDGVNMPDFNAILPVVCDCGFLARRLQSYIVTNPNRWFYVCKATEDEACCQFLEWEDQVENGGRRFDDILNLLRRPASAVSSSNTRFHARRDASRDVSLYRQVRQRRERVDNLEIEGKSKLREVVHNQQHLDQDIVNIIGKENAMELMMGGIRTIVLQQYKMQIGAWMFLSVLLIIFLAC